MLLIVKFLFFLCRKLRLEAPAGFWEETAENFKLIFNGAGPDWLPKWGRVILTLFLLLFAPAFFIHDWEYHYSDKTKESFEAANERMWRNMIKILDVLFGWWGLRWLYYYWCNKAWLAYQACANFGWSAWID